VGKPARTREGKYLRIVLRTDYGDKDDDVKIDKYYYFTGDPVMYPLPVNAEY
jgi:hypothetical protein